MFIDPFRNNFKSYLVLCKSETVEGKPALGSNRHIAEMSKTRMHEEPWYGIEQEYTLFSDGKLPNGQLMMAN